MKTNATTKGSETVSQAESTKGKQTGTAQGKGTGKPRGPKPLSPNGVKQALEREGKVVRQRRRAGRRGSTVAQKRLRELLGKARRCAQRYRRGQSALGRVVRQRKRCVVCYRRLRTRFSERDAAQAAARQYHVSVSTVRHYARLCARGGMEALLPHPKGPAAPDYVVSRTLETLIVALRVLYGWNEKRMAHELRQRSLGVVSHTTIGHIFHRHFLPVRIYHGKAKSEGITYRRYAKPTPNQQWHLDFAQVAVQEGASAVQMVSIAVVVDDASRFCIACQVLSDLRGETAVALLRLACQRLGFTPKEVVTDNGATFVSVYEDVPATFTKELWKASVRHLRTALYYPEGNGKAEAFVKTMKRECRTIPNAQTPFASMHELQETLDAFMTYYNFYRLHAALDYQPPAARYWGILPPSAHGLHGLPALPADLASLFLPCDSFVPPNIDPTVRRSALLPVPVSC